jgi:hypothetical protein
LFALAVGLAFAKPVTVPIDIGVGPAAHLVSGGVFADQPVHTGLTLSIQAVLDKKTIRKFKRQIPKKYRDMVMQMDEVRISPSIFIPDTLFISPGIGNTGMYGVSWRPISAGIPLSKGPIKVGASAGLRLTYAFLHSKALPSPTHFIRPGIDVKFNVEIPLSKKVLTSFGWDSQFYPPQQVGGAVFAFGPLDSAIWHVGQGYWKWHYRFPYKVKL